MFQTTNQPHMLRLRPQTMHMKLMKPRTIEKWWSREFNICHLILAGGFNPSEKYEFVSWDDIPNIWKVIKFMLQTTNQILNQVWNLHELIQRICGTS